METIILNKKEYLQLLKMKRMLEKILNSKSARKRKVSEKAFGVLKESFGKKSSVFYVSKMRKLWR